MYYNNDFPAREIARETYFTELEVDNFLAETKISVDEAKSFLIIASGKFRMDQILSLIRTSNSIQEMKKWEETMKLASRAIPLNNYVDRKKQ